MAPTDDDAIPIESDELPAGLATLVTRACDNHVSTVMCVACEQIRGK